MVASEPAPRTVVRIVLIVVAVVLTLYVIYLLRRPISWLVIATFLAVALAGPVNFLSRWMRRSFAIAVTYTLLILSPVLLGLLVIPPIVEEAAGLADRAPQYVADARSYVQDNETLRRPGAGLRTSWNACRSRRASCRRGSATPRRRWGTSGWGSSTRSSPR